ncbi:MAG: methyltransferase domain-containing protein [Pseudomonadota bacterium]
MELTRDAFLGGRLNLWQPRDGYRAGVDPVLLAAACEARAGQSVLELGCGMGTAILCLGARVPDIRRVGIELQPGLAELARRNADENQIPCTIHDGDLATMPPDLQAESFDHVIANPPYFLRTAGDPAENASRETALGETTPLAVWIDAARRRLKAKGYLTLIHRPDRMVELCNCLAGFGDVRIRPIAPRVDRDASLILIRARKGAKAQSRLLAPIIMHDGANHVSDSDDYSETARQILREGKSLPAF